VRECMILAVLATDIFAVIERFFGAIFGARVA
jgi:hypothetical protein